MLIVVMILIIDVVVVYVDVLGYYVLLYMWVRLLILF